LAIEDRNLADPFVDFVLFVISPFVALVALELQNGG
jgi:hypothetical protein